MVSIRSFRTEDATAAAGILRDCGIKSPDIQALGLRLRAARTLVAEQGGAPVGFASLSVSFGCTACVTAELTCLCVAPRYRGKGIGRALLTELEKYASSNAVSAVTASITEDLARFFVYAGYTVNGPTAVKRI